MQCHSLTQATHREGDSQFKWEQCRGDYLASNRVLAPTLRLKPFSITEISADVAPRQPDPLELLAPCPLRVCRFSASLLGHSVRPLISGGWLGTRGWLPSRLTDSYSWHKPWLEQCAPAFPLPPLFQARAKIDTGVSVFKKPLRGRRAPLSQRLISQLMVLIGNPEDVRRWPTAVPLAEG